MIKFASIGALALLLSVGAFWVGKKTEQQIIRTQFYGGPRRDLSQTFYELNTMIENRDFVRLSACIKVLKEEWDQSVLFEFEQDYSTRNYGRVLQKIDEITEPSQLPEPAAMPVTPPAASEPRQP